MFHTQVDSIKLGYGSIFIEEQLMAKLLISCYFFKLSTIQVEPRNMSCLIKKKIITRIVNFNSFIIIEA